MKVSVNTVKQFTEVPLGLDELVAKINSQLGGVEEIIDLSERYAGALIVKVVSCVDHENADKLHVCLIDDGGTVKDVERDKDGYVQVVCGAPNVRKDIFVVWLPPGATVPVSFDEAEPFVLGSRPLRGVVSRGMLASPKELGFGDNHDGILELTDADIPPHSDLKSLKPGLEFAQTFGLDDTVIDIENKMFTHRPDCFGQLGVAREIAGIQHQKFTSPDWCHEEPGFTSGDGQALTVTNDAPDVVSRFMAVGISGVEVKQSPVWLQAELVRMGGKPINNIVDVTNYVMLMTAQPMHAYDAEKLRGNMLGVRRAHKNEQLTLLNDKSYELHEEDCVIVDGEGPIGMAGVMGGAGSQVTPSTKAIVLECATFDMYQVRKMSMRHGLFTDAVTRFNKGQSPLQNGYVLEFAMQLLAKVAGGTLSTHIFDIHDTKPPMSVKVSTKFINDRLGLELKDGEVKSLLRNVEIEVEGNKTLKVKPPYWRTDITLPEDIVEEVGRLYGFDALPQELPLRAIDPVTPHPMITLQHRMRDMLSTYGANEVLTYSFVHKKTLERAGQNPDNAFKLSNALSPELQYYRLSVLPSLLDKVHPNIKAGYDEFMLFEIGKGHHKQAIGADGLPLETHLLELVYARKKPKHGAAYFTAQRVVTELLGSLGVPYVLKPMKGDSTSEEAVVYDASRTAQIIGVDGKELGLVGELKQPVLSSFKLPEYCAAVTLDMAEILMSIPANTLSYVPLSKYPTTSQDVSLKMSDSLKIEDISAAVRESIYSVIKDVDMTVDTTVTSIYRASDDDRSTTTTFRFTFTHYGKTLTDKEVTAYIDELVREIQSTIDCTRV